MFDSEKEVNIQWDSEITPKKNLFDINFKELWRYRDLVLLFVKKDFIATYKQTILGPLWHFFQPLFTTVVFLIVFTKLAKIPTNGIDPVLFYMSGLTLWNYFSTTLTATSSTFVSNANIFGKVYFPRLTLPISIIISNLIKFSIQFGLILLTMILFTIIGRTSIHIGINWLLIIPVIFIMAGISLGLGLIISSITTKYRDMNVLIGFGIQLLMYITPIIYPMSFLIGKSYSVIVKWNPLTPLMEGFRFALFNSGTLPTMGLIYSLIFMLISITMGVIAFNQVERNFMDTV